MTEKQLNENIIRNKIQCICQDCMYLDKIVPILNKMQNEAYIDGLEQDKLDKETKKQQLIDYLQSKIKEYKKHMSKLKFKGSSIYTMYQEKINLCREILDFIDKGD